jgi:hypothetical protein
LTEDLSKTGSAGFSAVPEDAAEPDAEAEALPDAATEAAAEEAEAEAPEEPQAARESVSTPASSREIKRRMRKGPFCRILSF